MIEKFETPSPEFNIGDAVYFMMNNKIMKGIVSGVLLRLRAQESVSNRNRTDSLFRMVGKPLVGPSHSQVYIEEQYRVDMNHDFQYLNRDQGFRTPEELASKMLVDAQSLEENQGG